MKRLYRSRKDKVIAGVSGGIAEYFEVDPALVRLVWVVLAFSGVGILAYIVGAIIIPEKPEPSSVIRTAEESIPTEGQEQPVEREEAGAEVSEPPARSDSSRVLGVVLVLMGAFLLARRAIPWFAMDKLWPVVLIALGVYFLAGSSWSAKK